MEKKSKIIIDELKKDTSFYKNQDKGNSLDKNVDINKKIAQTNLKIIKEEEKQKNQLRGKLVNTVIKIIWFQLFFFNIIVLLIVLSVTSDFPFLKNIDNNKATLLFNFLKYYITATIVELLGMLSFILHYVFSKYKKEKGI